MCWSTAGRLIRLMSYTLSQARVLICQHGVVYNAILSSVPYSTFNFIVKLLIFYINS